VWQYPTGLPSTTPCDASLNFDLGCNSFWLRADGWGTYRAQQAELAKRRQQQVDEQNRAGALRK
jgi:hypothetical protein